MQVRIERTGEINTFGQLRKLGLLGANAKVSSYASSAAAVVSPPPTSTPYDPPAPRSAPTLPSRNVSKCLSDPRPPMPLRTPPSAPAPLIGSEMREKLSHEDEQRLGVHHKPRTSGPSAEWFVRVDSKKVFGPFTHRRMELFVHARRERGVETSTEVRRGETGTWHTMTRASKAKGLEKQSSAYGVWVSSEERVANERARVEASERSSAAAHALQARLERVNAGAREATREENERRERKARERRAGANMLAKMWHVPADMILPPTRSHNSFEAFGSFGGGPGSSSSS